MKRILSFLAFRSPIHIGRFAPNLLMVVGLVATALTVQAQAADASRPSEIRDSRKKLVMLIAESEYETAQTLPKFAAQFLEKDFRVVVVAGSMAEGATAFSGIEELTDADLLLVSVRRRTPPKEQLDVIRRYVQSGKPVVGIRTACHAFKLMKGSPPAGDADWPEWDAEVIGGNYHNHYRIGSVATVTAVQPAHAILAGVTLPFTSSSTLYKVVPLRPRTEPLLVAAIAGESPEPVAWTFVRGDGGRTFYTSLGSPADFQNASFERLLRNGIFWAAGVESPQAAR
jgi:type 1 glutamine amidotransferase